MPKQDDRHTLNQRGLVGTSASMQALHKAIAKVAPSNFPVLLSGEVGVGKELVAKLIHDMSDRSKAPFVTISLASMPATLASSSLFGYVKGAFTGAVGDRHGMLKRADGGTIYLDDLNETPHEIQRLLVRFLAEGEFIPLGGSSVERVNVRVIAGLLADTDEQNLILPDLLMRLSCFVLRIPPLRERIDDIPLLVNHFMTIAHAKGLNRSRTFSREALDALKGYSFPGNVRELANIVARAAVMSEHNAITPDALALPISGSDAKGRDAEFIRRELDRAKQELSHIRSSTIPANPIWEGRWITAEKDYCFTLMPFAEGHDLQMVYTQHVKPVIENTFGLRCERADDIHDISGIMQSVWESINKARFVIADLTDRNSNVFYELGIAHTLGKPVIMITQSMEYVPFDLRHLRCILYEYKPGQIVRFEQSLAKTVKAVLADSTTEPSFGLVQE